ncbi:kinesin-like protein KIN-7J [Andrographis paniculata]|uniref:kinesin-like protein KIN-7J n=1 Tax=Andrographis paniculata TaxID=175694 RepID=UPI0021E8830F|nr:kinesin-like protein KIN-7J [Andrographis paniculata]
MGSTSGDSSDDWDMHKDNFFVSVRLRPLNEKELARNDVSDWQCINNTTVMFKSSTQDRSILPTVYTFDRVFGPEIPTKHVYEEAAKKVALSVLSGLNSSIFAYGQTSSGKTYTMSGITEYAVADIYDYIKNHLEREYVLKFSALEIYNEIVRDLLSSDAAPRRLLDDPVRGTVVERLTEVEVKDFSHLKELLSFCQAQRIVGETNLNEVSSRSHQILCLTVESETRRYFGNEDASSLMASVNFVDLAGSERSSQTGAAGKREKEGSHINRSLLTLGTVIRKLSKGRNGHVPFRDSKLTRILQNSLGGNSRTAIICTLSPAHCHVEQSKSTLVFANCARKISTNAHVNVITPEKALVKQLRREIARLENEVKTLSSLVASGDSASTLKEKELVEKLTEEIRQLTRQRDLVQLSGEDMLHSRSVSMTDFHNHEKGLWADECSASEASDTIDPFHSDVSSRTSQFSENLENTSSSRIEDQFSMIFLSDDTSPRLYIDKYFGPQSPPDPGWENFISDKELEVKLPEFQCIEFDFTKRNTSASMSSAHEDDKTSGKNSQCRIEEDISDPSVNVSGNISCSLLEKDNEKVSQNDAKIQSAPSNITLEEYFRSAPSTDCKNEKEEHITTSKEGVKVLQPESRKEVETEANSRNRQIQETSSSTRNDFKNEKESPIMKRSDQGRIKQQDSGMEELEKEIMSNLAKQFEDDFAREDPLLDQAIFQQVIQDRRTPDDHTEGRFDKDQDVGSSSNWHTKFEKQKQEIIELWAECNVPLSYRTYFFLLFKGDPSDTVYMEVELRRLSFLKSKLHGNRTVKDDQFLADATSAKALNQEREMLSRQMRRKLSRKERKALYQKWGVDPKTKRRRLQLCRKLWTDTTSMEHVKESAAIVAKLVGFKDPGNALKEMIGLSFLQKPDSHRASSWKKRRHSLSLPSLI